MQVRCPICGKEARKVETKQGWVSGIGCLFAAMGLLLFGANNFLLYLLPFLRVDWMIFTVIGALVAVALARMMFHQLQQDSGRPFIIQQGKMTTYRCNRCEYGWRQESR